MGRLIKLEDGTRFPGTAKGRMELEAHLIEEFRQRGSAPSFPNVGEWMLSLGIAREFKGQALPEPFRMMEPQMCFMNSFALATFNSDLTYCEGFVLREGLPILVHHAWCLRGDELVDPTLLDPDDEDSYYGIVFPDFSNVTKVVNDTGTYSVLFKHEGETLIERIAKEAGNG